MQSRSVLLPLMVSIMFMMETIDSTMLGTILPIIGHDFGVEAVDVKMAVSAYFIATAALIPLSSYLANVYGSRNVFVAALVTYVIGSVLCGTSTSLTFLVGARIVQGAGAAMMFPVGRAILVTSVEKADILRASSILGVPSAIALVVAPMLAGFVATAYDWRFLFLINVPIGVSGLMMTWWFVPRQPTRKGAPFDAVGFALLSIGLMLSGFALGRLVETDGATFRNLLMLAGGCCLLFTYVRHACSITHPIINLALFGKRTFAASIAGSFVIRACAVGSLPFILPLFLQLGFGFSALESGSTTFVGALAVLLVKFSIERTLRSWGFKKLLAVTAALSGGAVCCLVLVGDSDPNRYVIMSLLFVSAFTTAMQIISLEAMLFADVQEADMAQASTIISIIKPLSASTGVAYAALIMELSRLARGHHLIEISDFQTAIVWIAIPLALTGMLAVWLRSTDGEQISGRRPT